MDAKKQSKYYVYLALCANGSLYVGSTKNVEQRIAMHNAGQGGRYTRTNRPLKLLKFLTFNTKTAALKAEFKIKRLLPSQKLVVFFSDKTNN